LEGYSGRYPLGLEYRDALDETGTSAIVRVRKFCPQCESVYEGWFPVPQIESAQSVEDPEDVESEIVVDLCSDCVAKWEATRKRRDLELIIKRWETQLGRATRKDTVLRIGSDLLGAYRTLRGLVSFGGEKYEAASRKIEELEKMLNAFRVVKRAL
jgi:hypothetical protein